MSSWFEWPFGMFSENWMTVTWMVTLYSSSDIGEAAGVLTVLFCKDYIPLKLPDHWELVMFTLITVIFLEEVELWVFFLKIWDSCSMNEKHDGLLLWANVHILIEHLVPGFGETQSFGKTQVQHKFCIICIIILPYWAKSSGVFAKQTFSRGFWDLPFRAEEIQFSTDANSTIIRKLRIKESLGFPEPRSGHPD